MRQHWLGGGFERIARGEGGVGGGGSREEGGRGGSLEMKESVVDGGGREEGYTAELGVDIFISNEDFNRHKIPSPNFLQVHEIEILGLFSNDII